MTPILLNVDGMSDVTFNLKDVIYIVGFVITILGGWYTMKARQKDSETAIKALKDNEITKLQEEMISVKATKKALETRLMETIKEKDDIVHKRINKTQDDMKAYISKTDSEFKEINVQIAGVKQDTSEMKGMLKTLIDKK